MTETPHVPPPPAGGTSGASRDTAMLVLSYLWFLSIIPLVTKKNDPEVQWHAKNGLVLAIVYTAIEVIFIVFGHFFPVLSCLIIWAPCLVFVGYVIVVVMGIMKATSGQRFRIPMLSDYADKM
jgi:uncharacterized membrane protein